MTLNSSAPRSLKIAPHLQQRDFFLHQQDEIWHINICSGNQSSLYMGGILILWQVWCQDMPIRKMLLKFLKLSLRQKQRHEIFLRHSIGSLFAKT